MKYEEEGDRAEEGESGREGGGGGEGGEGMFIGRRGLWLQM
jgi:hypothetical protein